MVNLGIGILKNKDGYTLNACFNWLIRMVINTNFNNKVKKNNKKLIDSNIRWG